MTASAPVSVSPGGPAADQADDLSALYPALSGELSALAALAEGLQATTSALATAAGEKAASACYYNLQNLDLLTQRLHALAGFFSAMPDVQQAIGQITLCDLAGRLRGEEAAVQAPSDVVEFF